MRFTALALLLGLAGCSAASSPPPGMLGPPGQPPGAVAPGPAPNLGGIQPGRMPHVTVKVKKKASPKPAPQCAPGHYWVPDKGRCIAPKGAPQ